MAKGAVLIGCGFMPTETEVYDAVQEGYLKNCDTVATLGFESQVAPDLILTTYVEIAREQGWVEPIGLQLSRFTTGGVQQMWSVYPLG